MAAESGPSIDFPEANKNILMTRTNGKVSVGKAHGARNSARPAWHTTVTIPASNAAQGTSPRGFEKNPSNSHHRQTGLNPYRIPFWMQVSMSSEPGRYNHANKSPPTPLPHHAKKQRFERGRRAGRLLFLKSAPAPFASPAPPAPAGIPRQPCPRRGKVRYLGVSLRNKSKNFLRVESEFPRSPF